MKIAEFYREIEAILELPMCTINGKESLAELQNWDSLAIIAFIAMADSKLNAPVSAEQLASCKSVADLAGLFPNQIQY
jgi:hypothetical protein